ncbi:MAG: helix-turn-helix transcriptional regulator [Candidatus Aminicenantes bacterium]|nr:helix-turn-helix transcriptional regulator [Candidatus Aminicenantes bacterium]
MIKHFLLGFLPIQILHCAAREPFYGLWLIEELGRRGIKLSPGTVYPVLHAMEKKGLLQTSKAVVGGKVRKYYAATPAGRRVLTRSLTKVRTIAAEVLNAAEPGRAASGPKRTP